ncbi:hypothetical protein OG455_19430 [Kitasatospora sp. NBC_01287]|uniref:anti-sigma factor family protein n=1 Tax=Kitasatospora sp. NBC_01287 TaxID=2903573 RepID=UPI002250A730|nr:hypothetical protein [Kitasatospora sp. NBC_01287]MCX4747660.1 hypothetical protein [Kitasatospora sp. NBC_01287]
MNQTPESVESASPASHPTVDQLADLQEELLPPTEAAALADHLARCPDCSRTLAELSELTALLGADEPPPMPQDVARRIDAALAAALDESPAVPAPPVLPAAANPPVSPAPAAPTAPPHRADHSTGPGRTRPRRRRGALLAAAVACLAVLGGGTAAVLAGTSDGSSDAAHGIGAAARQPATPEGAAASGEATAPYGPALTAAGLPEQIRQLLPTDDHGALPHASSQQEAPATAGGPQPSVLPTCVVAAVGGHQGEQPLLVTRGSFQSGPVDVYVFRVSGDPAHLDVFLLTPDCAGSTPADVRLHQEVPAS